MIRGTIATHLQGVPDSQQTDTQKVRHAYTSSATRMRTNIDIENRLMRRAIPRAAA
jgi:hypothetical protein